MSLRTQFVDLIENGKHERQIEDFREVGERLIQWAKTRMERIDALRSFMETDWKTEQETKKRARDDSHNDHSHRRVFPDLKSEAWESCTFYQDFPEWDRLKEIVINHGNVFFSLLTKKG